ncbi:2-isopropylmalate synthase [Paramagnetospirillum kuznetsovii]|uniref:2-isopropylmalate synthase n=1 Tax=Paramagnetospirillum kuznetsovii TaxID=2053833 RepID=A0A364NUQ9_9PROT|nr:2-isopropylmalate synthase [Paramagnetospirillum kuznetsovii]RAU20803.1 2-isopropylmalate synthase [Paramagnetospirillum kuznetsovii]
MAMRKIAFNDITLRDGEQSPGVNFFPEEKLEIARRLAAMRVPIIEAGFAVSSESDWKGVNLIARELGGPGGPVICSMCRAQKKDIDAAFEALRPAARPRIQVVLATSDLHLEAKLKMTRDQALACIADTVAYARSLVDDVEFAAEDATRSDRDFLYTCFKVALDNGARTLEIPDTVGYATPMDYAAIVSGVLANVPGADRATIAVHCHDDLGLATANTLAGLAAGAGQAECTINGIGERAGNASFEEVIMAIRTRPGQWGVEADIDTTHLTAASQMVERLAHMAVAPNKAIVGRNAFRHGSGIHQHGMICNADTYQIIRPEDVGAPAANLDLGKLSGKHALKQRLDALHIDLSAPSFDRFYAEFKDMAAKKKLILDDDIINLAHHLAG